ncbi:hypothetical protein [Actinomycetospora termitidis]|uniref:Secreted protein n=1 Tax=Actinomycetospora termitidis TaxID=3053470 RepID=A0ABT7MJI7_9PSEU|nr:hypothetical protein [Actinomycetospora sp. Odt1-22]MDL5160379.1 hypothetical protein [Actinomycetospora sp. Odt1-22]
MTTVIVIIVVVVVLALVGGGLALARKKRSDQLQQEFGPEYDRVLEGSGSKGEAEKELAERRKRHQQLDLKPIDPQTRERFRGDWKRIQGEFVDDPGGAVEKADSLVTTIMRERGYPVDDFDQRANDISVEHPRVVENYREARRVRDAQRDGSADTEDLRGAVTSYRSLVDALLDESGDRDGGEHGRDGRDHDRRDDHDRGPDDSDRGRHRDDGHHVDDRDRADRDRAGHDRAGADRTDRPADHDQARDDDRSRR